MIRIQQDELERGNLRIKLVPVKHGSMRNKSPQKGDLLVPTSCLLTGPLF